MVHVPTVARQCIGSSLQMPDVGIMNFPDRPMMVPGVRLSPR